MRANTIGTSERMSLSQWGRADTTASRYPLAVKYRASAKARVVDVARKKARPPGVSSAVASITFRRFLRAEASAALSPPTASGVSARFASRAPDDRIMCAGATHVLAAPSSAPITTPKSA
jgi:hypothetical protein